MARRSQCSSAGDNPLDPNYLPPHYREEYRLAVDALIEADLEGYYEFLHKANVVDFLSQPEKEYIKCTVQGPRTFAHPDRSYMVGDADGSSDTYWPVHTDVDAPALDLGWPQQHRFVGPTEITTLVNPPEPEMPSIKEQARRMIKNAQQVIAVAMDMFTDVDIFADILNAALHNVAVYVLLDELNAHHFFAMVNNFRVNLDEIKFMRVRTISGSTYFCHTGKSFKGQMMNCFMLVDCRVVLCGNYSFMWSFEKIHRCIAHVFLGQLVTTFDKEFRILYAQSEPLVAEIPMTHVEDYGNFPERHYNIENMNVFKREYPHIKDICTAWPRRSFEDHMNANARILSFKRGESIHKSTEENLSLQMHGAQQFRREQSLDHKRLMKSLNTKEICDFPRLQYTGLPNYAYVSPQKNAMNSGRQEMEGTEIQSVHFPREQYYNQRTGPEPKYEIHSKSRDYGSQFKGADCPNEMQSSDFDHVHKYLQSYPAVEADPTGNLLVPVQSVPSRHSMSQSHACQTPPTQPNPSDQNSFFNVHHKQQEQKEGLRDWRVSSYLTALQYGGQNNMIDLQRTDIFVNIPYAVQERPQEPEISEIKNDNTEPAKVSTSRLNPLPVPPMNSLTLPENSADVKNSRPFVTNAQVTPPTISESSYTTDGNKVEENKKRESKETNLNREEFFRRKPNVPLQRSSRLRHSLIFNSNLEQDTSEELRNSEKDQKDAENPLKHSRFISNILEKKISVTREPFQQSNVAQSFCEPSSDSTVCEDIMSRTEQVSIGEETTQTLIKDVQQEITLDPQSFPHQEALAEHSQISQLPSIALQRAVYFTDMNDHKRRLRYFKELAAKHKKHALVELPKPTKDKDSKNCEKKTSISCNLAEQIKSALKNPQTLQASRETLLITPQTLLVDNLENSEDTVPKQPALQSISDKHLKHKLASDPRITKEITSAPKCVSASKVIPDTATDAEKIKHKKKLTGGGDSSSNRVQETRFGNTVVELSAKPKLTSQLITISSPEVISAKNKSLETTKSVASHLSSATSSNNSKLTSSHIITGASQHSPTTDTGPSQHSCPTEKDHAGHPAETEKISSVHTTVIVTDQHPVSTSSGKSTPQHPTVKEAASSAETDIDQHPTHIIPDTDSSQLPTATEMVSSVPTTLSVIHQHSSHAPPEKDALQNPPVTEMDFSAHATVTVTDQQPTPTLLQTDIQHLTATKMNPFLQTSVTLTDRTDTSQHSTAIEMNISLQTVSVTDQYPTPTLPKSDGVPPPTTSAMVSSAQTTLTATDQHPALTLQESDIPQHFSATEMDSSLQTTVKVTDQYPSFTPIETGTPEYSTPIEPNSCLYNTVSVTDEHPSLIPAKTDTPQPQTATETVCSLHAEVRDQDPTPTPSETDTPQNSTAETTDQHSIPTPPETDIANPQTATERNLSLYTAVTVTDQHIAFTPPESVSSATEISSSLHPSVTITDKHPTPTPSETGTPQHSTAQVIVSAVCTAETGTNQQLPLTPPETIIPQYSNVTKMVSSTNTITVTDQHHTPAPPDRSTRHLSATETNTPQHPIAEVMVSSVCSTVTITDQQLPPETIIPQHVNVTYMVSSTHTTSRITDQHPTPTPMKDTPQNFSTETVSSEQTTVTPIDQHSIPTPPETDPPQSQTATEKDSSLYTAVIVTDQHPALSPPESISSATEISSSLHPSVTITDKHPTPTPSEPDTPQHLIVTETVFSLHTEVTDQDPSPIPAETDTQHSIAKAMVSSVCTAEAVIDHQLSLTPRETIIPQHVNVSENVSSTHTTITIIDQKPTPTPVKDTPQNFTATETVPSEQPTVTPIDQHSIPTPPETHPPQPQTATERDSSLYTAVTVTDQHPALIPLESITSATEMSYSLHTSVTITDEYPTHTPSETDTSQHAAAAAMVSPEGRITVIVPSAQNTIPVKKQHIFLTPGETNTTQDLSAIETKISLQTSTTVTDQYPTPIPPRTDSLPLLNAALMVSSAQTTLNVTDNHATTTILDTPVTEMDHSLQTSITVIDQYPTLIPTKTDTPQPQAATEIVSSLHIAVTDQHPTPSPPQHTPQHLTTTDSESSVQITVIVTDQCPTLSPVETNPTPICTATETVPSLHTTVRVTDQHSTLISKDTPQPQTATETICSLHTEVTEQHPSPTPEQSNTTQHSNDTEMESFLQTRVTVTDQHPTPIPPDTNTQHLTPIPVKDTPQNSTITQTISSAQTTVTATDQHSIPPPPETDTAQPQTATEMDSSLQTTVTVIDQHSTHYPLKTNTLQPQTATETVCSLHTAVTDQDPTPAETNIPQHPTAEVMISSVCTAEIVTDQQLSPETIIPQYVNVTDTVSSAHPTITITDQHPTPTPVKDTPQNFTTTETVSSEQTTVTAIDQHSIPTSPETDPPQPQTATENNSSLYTAVTVTDQHSALSPPETIISATEMSSLHPSVTITDKHPTPTPSETHTPQHPTAIAMVSSLANATIKVPSTYNAITDSDSSVQIAVTVTDQCPTLSLVETNTTQLCTATETVSSLHTTVRVAEQHPTLIPTDTPQPQMATKTICSLHAKVTEQHPILTPNQTDTTQHSIATEVESSLQTTLAVTDQYLTTPPRRDIQPSPTVSVMVSSAQATLIATDQQPSSTAPDTGTHQHLSATEMDSSLKPTVTITDQQLPPETIIPQHVNVTYMVSSAHTTLTITDQHPTPTPVKDTPQNFTTTETVSSEQTTVTAIDQHSIPSRPETDPPQPQSATEKDSSLYTAVTVTDQHPALIPLESITSATEMSYSLHTSVTITDEYPTHTPSETDTSQHAAAAAMVSPEGRITVIVPSAQNTIPVKKQHIFLTPGETNTTQDLSAIETKRSLQTSTTVTDQYPTPTPPRIDSLPLLNAALMVSSAQTTLIVTDNHATTTILDTPVTEMDHSLRTDPPQPQSATEKDSSLYTAVTVTDQHPALTPPESISSATEISSSLHPSVTITDKYPTPTPSEPDTPQHPTATETVFSLHTEVTDQDPTSTPPETDTPQHSIAKAVVSSVCTAEAIMDQQLPLSPRKTIIPQHVNVSENVSSTHTTITIIDQQPTPTPVKDTSQNFTTTETVPSEQTIVAPIDQHSIPTPPETDPPQPQTATEKDSSLYTAVTVTDQHPALTPPESISSATEISSSLHPSVTITDKYPTPTPSEPDTPQHPTATETVFSLHTEVTDQHPTSTPPETETSHCQHPTSREASHSQKPTSRVAGHFQYSAPAETLHAELPAVTEIISSVLATETVASQPPTPAETDIPQHSTATDTVSSVYPVKVTEKHSSPTQPETDTSQYSTAMEIVPSAHKDQHCTPSPIGTDIPQHPTSSKHIHVETETAQHRTATATHSYHSISPAQCPTPTVPIISTSEKVKSSFGVQIPKTFSSLIHLSQEESESCINLPETCSVTNTTDTDRSQNVSLIGTMSSTEHSQRNLSSNCPPPEYNATSFSREKESSQTKQSSSLKHTQLYNDSTLCLLDPTPKPLTSVPSVMDGLSHNSAAACKPVNLVRENQRDHEVTKSDSHIPSKPVKELFCPQDPKAEKNTEENQRAPTKIQKTSDDSGRHGTAKVPVDVENSNLNKVKEFTTQVPNVGFSSADHSEKPQCCLVPCIDLMIQQQTPAGKTSILSSYQHSSINVLSCSNLRDDTKVLLEQISAKNQGRAPNLSHEAMEGEAKGKRQKQTSGHHTQTWSSKASSEEREKLLERIESMRKERKVYSRFEA